MPDIVQQLHQHQPNFWSFTTDCLLAATCGISVPYVGVSYSLLAFESQGDANAYSLCYVSDGQARIRIDTEFYRVSSGDVVLFHPLHPYAIYPDAEQPWEWCWIIMGGAPIDDIVREMGWASDRCPLVTCEPACNNDPLAGVIGVQY